MLKSAWDGYGLLPLHLHPGPDLNQKSDVSFGQIFHLLSTLPDHSSVFYIYTWLHTVECKRRSALLSVPDTTWCPMECNLTQPCSWFQWWYNRIQTSLNSTLCFRHHMAYKGMWTLVSPTHIWHTKECEPCSALLCVPDSVWRTMECEPYSALLCVPDSIWRTMECELTQPCSVAPRTQDSRR